MTTIQFSFFMGAIKELGVFKNKHIPMQYLRASIEQRKELLRGILDTDGCCSKKGQIEVGFSNKRLMDDTLELISTLGIKGTITQKEAKCNGKSYGLTYKIKFMADFPAFKLKRKLERQKLTDHRLTTKFRYITNVEKVDPVPMRCIQVNHPDGMYLIGKTCIPTHNSFALLVDPLRDCDKREHRALIIRKTMPELRDIISKTHSLYPKAFPGAKWREQDKMWVFPSGARIEFGYADNAIDALRYQGQAYSYIGVDELPQYPDPEIYHMLRGSLRRTDPRITPYFRSSGNPGNAGSMWVKEMFIDPAPPNTTFTEEVKFETPDGPKVTKITRRFIPATVWDNPFLTFDDKYVTMLATLPEHLRKQWLEGDWTVFENCAFPEFRPETHVVEPFEIPSGWTRIRGADWGYASPHCVLWAAIDWDGNLYVYREKYGSGETADVFSARVLEMDRGEQIKYGVLDSSAWSNRGDTSPSPAETMAKFGLRWRPADRSPKSRINGKMELHRRLSVDAVTEKPRLVIFNNCRNLIRTLPMLPLDDNNLEDVDTDTEDHAYDALRYLCMSRPVNKQRKSWQEFNLMDRKGTVDRFTPASRTFGY